ncbi:hypothetical protein BU14_2899s0001 [Porphyra umbilicalis]|uniref:Uncharacterized protein n=1 Tax=Porphyra umbilicalis TaxID=2786 RepID=A0A1X6NIE7_PORUM|nr:hypothetical protein BU14_2899s0001 [Porphyra umbilicalis]|eukprot:OSX68385.1 hypothetical protein BU14_2899s0001 [Porphyra umbilicalis]
MAGGIPSRWRRLRAANQGGGAPLPLRLPGPRLGLPPTPRLGRNAPCRWSGGLTVPNQRLDAGATPPSFSPRVAVQPWLLCPSLSFSPAPDTTDGFFWAARGVARASDGRRDGAAGATMG